MERLRHRKYTITNEKFRATLESAPDNKPEKLRFDELVFQAISEPGVTQWYGDFWIVCTSKDYKELQFWPEHRPIWMTYGEWDQLKLVIKNYRLAFALTEKPLFMSEEEWNNLVDIKNRHGLLPDTKTELTMDQLEKILDDGTTIGAIRLEYPDGRVVWIHPEMYKQMKAYDKKLITEYPLRPDEAFIKQDLPGVGGEEFTITL